MRKQVLIIGLVLLIIMSIGLFSCTMQPANTVAKANELNTQVLKNAGAPQVTLPSIADVVTKVRPSVVAINVQVTTFDFFNNPVQEQGAGSGWIIRSDGYIVTNNHVVEGADNIVVTTSNGNKYDAQEVFTDAFTDLAVIKINANNLQALPTGDSSKLNVGDWVVAIGNALGQGISATTGIVSAKDVSLTETAGQPLDNLVQTDTAINPGNSGGPLVNLAGEVIGITSLKISQVGVEGMGYAISINQALPVINTLITSGKVVRPWMGIAAFTVDAQVSAYYDLTVDSGVLITDVVSGSPADQAGLQPGDVITAVNGQAQTDAGNLMNYINTLQVGQQITVTYQRGRNQGTADVTLGQSPS
jgi:serine protease Do